MHLFFIPYSGSGKKIFKDISRLGPIWPRPGSLTDRPEMNKLEREPFDDDYIQWHPPLIGNTPILTVTDLVLITEFEFLPNYASFA